MIETLFILAGIIVIILYFKFKEDANKSESNNSKKSREIWEIGQEEKFDKMEQLCKTEFKDNNSEFQELINNYMPKLLIKREQLFYTDDYGDYVVDDWVEEQQNFINNKLYKFTSKLNQKVHLGLISHFGQKNGDDIFETSKEYIESFLKQEMLEDMSELIHSNVINNISINNDIEIDLIDPIGYEKSIEQIFSALGWEARQTKSSGDQGADVIAEKDGYICIIQCKLYSQPVGNKAVQECFSATKFYNGDSGIVVTNNSYTKSARTLADSNGIKLLHHSEIEKYVLSLPFIS